MKKYKIMKIARTLIQVLFFIFLPGLVSLSFMGVKLLFVDLFTGNFAHILLDSGVFLILAISTMLFGRFFCGWMCMFGSYNDFVHLFGTEVCQIKTTMNPKVDQVLKYLKYMVLLFIAGFVWTNMITMPSGWSPWDAMMQVTSPSTLFQNYMIGLILLVLITVGAFFYERFFCRYLCPMGAIFSLLAKTRILKIHKNRSICGSCRLCTLKCSMGINLDQMDIVTSGECINCMNCTSVCPKRNATFKVSDTALNQYAVGALTIAGTTGAILGLNALTSSSVTDSTTTTEVTSSIYNDGTYTGTGTGYRGTTKVSVTISNGKITNIVIVSTGDTDNFFQKAWSSIKSAIISKQSTSVSTVSGATYSSRGILEAVSDALENAKKVTSNETTTDNNSSNSENTNTDTNNTSTSSNSNTTTNNSSTNSNSITTNSTTSTGSSTSSATTTSTYKDGTYTGTGTGYRNGTTTVSVTISGGKITEIVAVSNGDSQNFFQRAWSTIKSTIISKQSTSVSTVSGATFSSRGIIEAVNNALAKAK